MQRVLVSSAGEYIYMITPRGAFLRFNVYSSQFNVIQFIRQLRSLPFSKVHYGSALNSSRINVDHWSTTNLVSRFSLADLENYDVLNPKITLVLFNQVNFFI